MPKISSAHSGTWVAAMPTRVANIAAHTSAQRQTLTGAPSSRESKCALKRAARPSDTHDARAGGAATRRPDHSQDAANRMKVNTSPDCPALMASANNEKRGGGKTG